MVNAYPRGAVEVLYAGAVEVLYADAVEVCSWCGRGTLEVRSRYACGAVEVPSWCGQGTLRLWCGRGTLVVRSRYACGAVEVRSRCGRAVEVRSWFGPSTVEICSWSASSLLPVRYF